MKKIALVIGVWAATLAAGDFEGLFPGGLDHPAIEYASRAPQDRVSKLNRALEAGQAALRFEGPQGYLRAILDALQIPVESQIAVFSKTSLQAQIIHPGNPRAIYFNDAVAAAWVPGEPFVEMAAADPQQGVVFYTLDQRRTEAPRFVRRDLCLSCHEAYASLGVPGMLARSVFPGADGRPLRQFGFSLSDHRSPWAERWGGHYVTGKSGPPKHLGNGTLPTAGPPEALLAHAIPKSLEGRIGTAEYLTPYSDVVALLLFEHQMHLVNLLTRAGWEVRAAEHERREPARLLEDVARQIADYLLFVDEAPLAGRVEGTSGFETRFAQLGPKDSRGRSLRQFDLTRRMMRYPCSYMIYSEVFDGLPAKAREAIYARMWRILSGEEKGARYARLSAADRTAVIEILHETKPGLPAYFQARETGVRR